MYIYTYVYIRVYIWVGPSKRDQPGGIFPANHIRCKVITFEDNPAVGFLQHLRQEK